jgi:hypothetical protein
MTRNEDYGQRAAASNQFFLQLEAAETRHTNIEHQAPGATLRFALQKLVCGREDLVR